MTELMQIKWLHLTADERKELLKDIFFDVLFHHRQLPGSITEQDWSDLFRKTKVLHFPSNKDLYTFVVIVCLDILMYRSAFSTLKEFLRGPIANAKVQGLELFASYDFDNSTIEFKFNLEAVFLWMSQQQH